MKTTLTQKLLASVLILLGAGSSVLAQDDPGTFWNFLGIPNGVNKVKDNILNRRGNRPGLERTPPLKGIADPAFLEAEIAKGIPMPKALAEAAKVKIQEDLAPQKIKAVKFLAKMGCGCYNDDGGIVDALAEALDDCTEDVRMATIEALTEVAAGETCDQCKTKSCCDEKLLMKLAEIAFDRDETGCYKERNEDVRAAAVEALEACCPSPGPIVIEEELPGEGPETPPVPDVTPETPNTVSSHDPNAVPVYEVPYETNRRTTARPEIFVQDEEPLRTTYDTNPETINFTSAVLGRKPQVLVSDNRLPPPPAELRRVPTGNEPPVFPGSASVGWVNSRDQLIKIEFDSSASVPTGANVQIMHRFITGVAAVGRFQVVQTIEGAAFVRPIGRSRISSVARGDEVVFLR